MRTARALTVSPSMLCAGGVSAPGGVGCLLWGGVCFGGGMSAPGGCIPACTEADPPVNRITDACKNITFVAGGNNCSLNPTYHSG